MYLRFPRSMALTLAAGAAAGVVWAQSGPVDPVPPLETRQIEIAGDAFFWDGAITAESVKNFKALVAANPDIKKLIIRSHGGYSPDGLMAAHLIRTNKFNVYVRDYCNSACADYVALAAKQLYVPENAILAFHGFWPEKPNRAKERRQILAIREAFKNLPDASKATRFDLDENVRQNIRRQKIDLRENRKFFREIGVNPCLLKCLNFLFLSGQGEAWMFSREALVNCFNVRNIAEYPTKLSETAGPKFKWRTICPER